MTGIVQSLLGDGALLLVSVAGLAATTVAILRDTKAQRAEIRLDR